MHIGDAFCIHFEEPSLIRFGKAFHGNVYQFGIRNTKMNGKLKVKMIGRKLYLPKELVKKAGLPENGNCEAILIGDEVRIRRESHGGELSMLKMLSAKPVIANIDRMSRASEVEDD